MKPEEFRADVVRMVNRWSKTTMSKYNKDKHRAVFAAIISSPDESQPQDDGAPREAGSPARKKWSCPILGRSKFVKRRFVLVKRRAGAPVVMPSIWSEEQRFPLDYRLLIMDTSGNMAGKCACSLPFAHQVFGWKSGSECLTYDALTL